MGLEFIIFSCGAICLIIGATGYALGYSAGVSYAIKRMKLLKEMRQINRL